MITSTIALQNCSRTYSVHDVRKWAKASSYFEGILRTSELEPIDLNWCPEFEWLLACKYMEAGGIPDPQRSLLHSKALYQLAGFLGMNLCQIPTMKHVYSNMLFADQQMIEEEKLLVNRLSNKEEIDIRDFKTTVVRDCLLTKMTFDKASQSKYVRKDDNDITMSSIFPGLYGRVEKGRIRVLELDEQTIDDDVPWVFEPMSRAMRNEDNAPPFISLMKNVPHIVCVGKAPVLYLLQKEEHLPLYCVTTSDLNQVRLTIRQFICNVLQDTNGDDLSLVQFTNGILLKYLNAQNRPKRLFVSFKLYSSVVEILTRTPLDLECIACDANDWYCLPRFMRAYLFGYNLVDPTKVNPTYGRDLSRFFDLGFQFVITGNDQLAKFVPNFELYKHPKKGLAVVWKDFVGYNYGCQCAHQDKQYLSLMSEQVKESLVTIDNLEDIMDGFRFVDVLPFTQSNTNGWFDEIIYEKNF